MKANRFAKTDEGVSAVIGVILMVAITVILAAVIAAFVFGMVGNVKRSYAVGATMERINAQTVIITYIGGKDAVYVTGLHITEPISGFTDFTGTSVGSMVKITGALAQYPCTALVTASFEDGSTSVIMKSTL